MMLRSIAFVLVLVSFVVAIFGRVTSEPILFVDIHTAAPLSEAQMGRIEQMDWSSQQTALAVLGPARVTAIITASDFEVAAAFEQMVRQHLRNEGVMERLVVTSERRSGTLSAALLLLAIGGVLWLAALTGLRWLYAARRAADASTRRVGGRLTRA